MQLAAEVGIDPKDVNYISYDGGGPLTTALLGEKIDVGMSGLGEFEGQIEDGTLRVLAVSGDERLDGVDAPTLTEAGVDLVFTNWRGVLAPPDISDEQREYLVDLFTEMHETDEWQDALESQRLDRQLRDRRGVRGLPRRAGRPCGGRPSRSWD